MKQYISKRAVGLDDFKTAILHLWHPDEGPFQNVFGRILSNLTPFIPGIGLATFVIEKVASMNGFGLGALGKYIDQQLNLYPGSNVNPEHFDKGGQLLEQLFKAKNAGSKNGMIKNAFFGGLIIKAIPTVFKLLAKAFLMILTAVGVDQVSDLYAKIKANPLEYAKERYSPEYNLEYKI
jgi:hypothetical protein